MTSIPLERRMPSLVLALSAVAMPGLLLGVPAFVFGVFYREARPPITVQYRTFATALVTQGIAYAIGIHCLSRLRKGPQPATVAGAQFTRVFAGLFIGLGGLWCALCYSLLVVITNYPW